MDKQLTNQDILTAKEACLAAEETLWVAGGDGGHLFRKGGTAWRDGEAPQPQPGERPRTSPISPAEALQIYLEWTGDPAADNRRLDAAIVFAVSQHAGQFRKGTARPYILHPLEVLLILHAMRADTDLLMAGVLHDTIEDTGATADQIRELFGADVAGLVAAHSEDKSMTWVDRKTLAIRELAQADRRLQMLIMADKVSNLRSMAADYARVGQALWARFNAPVSRQAWYYSGALDALQNMQDDPDCAPVYWEMTGLFKDLFVTYWLDERTHTLYQTCFDQEAYRLHRGNPEWQVYDPKTLSVPANAARLDRKAAERLEDEWNAAFWAQIDRDLADADLTVFASSRRYIDCTISDKKLTLAVQDLGPECQAMTGDDEYESFYDLDRDGTRRFLCRLRIEYGLTTALRGLLREAFGADNGPTRFTDFCDRNGIPYGFSGI